MKRALATIVCGSLVVASACSSGSSADPDESAPLPSPPSSTESVETTSTTTSTTPETVPPETAAPSSAPSTELPVDRYLPEGLGTVVDSAPGIDSPGEITELVDNVWFFVPSEPVEGDSNVVPPLPEDREILIAYAEALAALHEHASMNPMPTEPTPRLAAALADGGTRIFENVLGPAAAAGHHLDATDGMVLRPVVVADPRSDTEAFIFDCQLDGTVFVDSTGALVEGQTRGVRQFPQIASVVHQDGRWIVDRLTRDERACT